MKTIIVVPCYNEQQHLMLTCLSLGFGTKNQSEHEDHILIIVDNNSTDFSRRIARQIRSSSPSSQVVIVNEREQGYVPARRRGNHEALKIAERLEISPSEILILQADSDTIYSQGYVNEMTKQAVCLGKNKLIQAQVKYESIFYREHPQYIELCNKIDEKFQSFYGDMEHDFIVDDKAAGYWLSDYFLWGGHRSSLDSNGQEIYAETTRLFLSAKALGASRADVSTAFATHSSRKIIQNCVNHFVTAGFPRTYSWQIAFQSTFAISTNDCTQCLKGNISVENIHMRELHLLALFYILPLHVDLALANHVDSLSTELAAFLVSSLPTRTAQDLLKNPGLFLSDSLEIIDKNSGKILELAEQTLCKANTKNDLANDI